MWHKSLSSYTWKCPTKLFLNMCEMLWRLSTESCVRRQTGMILSVQKAVEIPQVRFQDLILVMRNLDSSKKSAPLPVLLRHQGR